MKSRIIILFGVFSLLVTIIIYVLFFYDVTISDRTSDWGAFGSYIGIGISVLSVTLIYITYNEQRHSNEIERFELHLKTMLGTFSELIEKKSASLDRYYQLLSVHFLVPFYDISNYDKQKTENVCSCYFSNMVNTDDSDCIQLFKYMTLLINEIKNKNSFKTLEKEERMIELSCIIPTQFRFLYFFWLTYNKDHPLLQYCYENRMFFFDNDDETILGDIIKLVCTGTINKKSSPVTIDADSIELEDYSKETFDQTYNRLFNDK